MKGVITLLVLSFLPALLFGQFNKDSLYSYGDLQRILEFARKNNDQNTLAEVYIKLGDYEGDIFSKYEKSLEYYQRSLEYFKVKKDSDGIHKANHAIARRYIDAEFYTEASGILENLISIYKSDNQGLQLAYVYFDLGRLYKARGDISKATEYLNKAVVLSKTHKDEIFELKIIFEKIQNYEEQNELDSALYQSFEAFKLSNITGNRDLIAKSLYHIGHINKLGRNFERAIKYMTDCEMIIPFQPYSETRKSLYRELAEVYALSGRHREGFLYLKKYTALNDSILNKSRHESLTNLAMKYGTKDIKSNIELLKIEKEFADERNRAQRRTLYILAIGLFVVTISIYFIVKFYDQRISTARIISEQKEEINHQKIRELEDNLKMNSMRSVITGQEIERERIAKDLHDSLGGLLSTIKLQFDNVRSKKQELADLKEYNHAHKLLDTAVDEVRTISRNLQPGSLHDLGLVSAIKDLINRFEGDGYPEIDFQYYEMPEKMDKMISLLVYRIIQELLNNSLKHAQAKEILIQINTEDNELVIQYEDDGVGFDQNNLKRKGMGLENIKSRVNYMHGSLIMDSKQDEGMSVLIRIRYQ
ncbi:MAG: sensor histidine kinase [Saprospiraceae bacterium]|nr:sensor histidine kinase [Saprospiraceae bacterium]